MCLQEICRKILLNHSVVINRHIPLLPRDAVMNTGKNLCQLLLLHRVISLNLTSKNRRAQSDVRKGRKIEKSPVMSPEI